MYDDFDEVMENLELVPESDLNWKTRVMIPHQLVDADPALRPRHGPDEGAQSIVADRGLSLAPLSRRSSRLDCSSCRQSSV